MSCAIASVRIPAGDQPVCGVRLDPYILIKDDSANIVPANSIPDESNDLTNGEPEPSVVLRSRWYRQATSIEDCVCSVHPDRPASVQCVLCLKHRVPINLSFHCSGECLKAHWAHHRYNHNRYLRLAQEQYMQNGGAYENGYIGPYPTANMGYCRNSSSTVANYKSEDYEWIEVSCKRSYSPVQEDVGCYLRYECSLIFQGDPNPPLSVNGVHANGHSTGGENNRQHKMSKETGRVKLASSSPGRRMIQLRSSTPHISQEGRFTVLSYNLLADLYALARDFTHSYCPDYAISWNYRRQNLVRELLSYGADIMCLQEVQSNHYEDYLKDVLAQHGYEGVYKRKTYKLYTGKHLAIDGCATFYKKDRFLLVKKYEVEFNKAAVTTANNYREPTKNVALQRLSKDNVALIVVLESRKPMMNSQNQLVCVANTHIHSDPENSDIKLWQVYTLLKGLEKIASSVEIPIIVTGDFNSQPGSAAHTLLVSGRIDKGHPETTNDPAQFLQQMLPVEHNLPLRSAYSALLFAQNSSQSDEVIQQRSRMDAVTREPLFTNYTDTFKGTLDYIFYTSNMLSPTALLELPSEEEPDIENGIPNDRYSSDHICIMAEFQVNSPYDNRL
eukprot:g4935.t1